LLQVKSRLLAKTKGLTSSSAQGADNDKVSSTQSKGPVEPASTMMAGGGRQGTPAIVEARQDPAPTVDATVGTLGMQGPAPAKDKPSVGLQDVSLEGLTEEEKDEKVRREGIGAAFFSSIHVKRLALKTEQLNKIWVCRS
jgi:hypothetical protein